MSHAPRFHRLAVSDLRREAADAVSMTFAIPKELEDDYSFTPGQYLTLRTTMDGEEVRRSYSICSGPDDGELRIAVKKVDGGAFSNWAADELKSGDELDVMTPTGRFGIAHAPGEARVYVGFAAGSGITPILSIVKGVLAREPNSRFFLFYGNRSTSSMLFLEERLSVDWKGNTYRFLADASVLYTTGEREESFTSVPKLQTNASFLVGSVYRPGAR
jgi:ring-1,2-phenylacetyl-CoA epoxidase subunit PaaE